ncbi:MAG: hypothetical protein OHK0024_28050 [Thalassobaculales bacterium]
MIAILAAFGPDVTGALVPPPDATPVAPGPALQPSGDRELVWQIPPVEIPDLPVAREVPAWDLAPPTVERVIEVQRGNTLMELLVGAGIKREEAFQAIGVLRGVWDPRKLRAGQEVTLTFAGREGDGSRGENAEDGGFLGLTIRPSVEREISVMRAEDGNFASIEIERPLSPEPAYGGGTIVSSLYEAAVSAEVPVPVLMEMVKAFSYDVDFQRDIQPGDRFEVVWEQLIDEDGSVARDGEVIYAAMTLSGRTRALYRHTPGQGPTDFFDERGQSVRKELMRTPLDGARITSGFGRRKHPILGFTKMHKGVDFGAPTGTPVMAAGHGVVEKAGPNGGYGNYVRLRHNASYSTAYAHLSGFARGIAPGQRVRQGQVIGYVGSTGQSTGPHLHYEVLRGGEQVNPLSVAMPAGEKLTGRELFRFEQTRRDIQRLVQRLRPSFGDEEPDRLYEATREPAGEGCARGKC